MSSEYFWALMARFEVKSWVELVWAGIGLGGQFFFFMRFFIQWIASERKKRSVVPLAFWYFSIGGGAVLLAYACYKRDLVFILGQGGGLIIYVRNLMLIYKHRARLQAAGNPAAPPEGGD
jgi:lipid-A-disaccharide synthase-like uncharacterized protein